MVKMKSLFHYSQIESIYLPFVLYFASSAIMKYGFLACMTLEKDFRPITTLQN